MSPSMEDKLEESSQVLPSIPILGCRWGLGEGVSPTVFKPVPIPHHLLQSSDVEGGWQPPRGRGRAALLRGEHSNLMAVPGGQPGTVSVTSLPISEQISRVQHGLAIHQGPTDYTQYILPRSTDDDTLDSSAAEAAVAPPKIQSSLLSLDDRRHRDWGSLLDGGGEVAAVDSAQLTHNALNRETELPAGVRALQSLALSEADSDPDLLEERTDSSDSDHQFVRVRRYRPRPPPLTADSFPPLPGAAAADVRSPAKPDRRAEDPPRSGRRPGASRTAGSRSPAERAPDPGLSRAAPSGPSELPRAAPSGASGASDPELSRAAPSGASGAAPGETEPQQLIPAGAEVSCMLLRVTGVTEHNWEDTKAFAEHFGTVAAAKLGENGEGWITLTPEDTGEWLLSVQEYNPCDVDGVVFAAADN